jgi:hypothetical protein
VRFVQRDKTVRQRRNGDKSGIKRDERLIGVEGLVRLEDRELMQILLLALRKGNVNGDGESLRGLIRR